MAAGPAGQWAQGNQDIGDAVGKWGSYRGWLHSQHSLDIAVWWPKLFWLLKVVFFFCVCVSFLRCMPGGLFIRWWLQQPGSCRVNLSLTLFLLAGFKSHDLEGFSKPLLLSPRKPMELCLFFFQPRLKILLRGCCLHKWSFSAVVWLQWGPTSSWGNPQLMNMQEKKKCTPAHNDAFK